MSNDLKEKTVYLSGAMLDCTDAECRDWRDYAKKHLNALALDPMIRDYRKRPMDGMIAMVENDKADIDACDTILVNFVNLRWFNKSEEKPVFGKISKICGKNTMMNLSDKPSRKFLMVNQSGLFLRS